MMNSPIDCQLAGIVVQKVFNYFPYKQENLSSDHNKILEHLKTNL
jgi:hypothetical protein